MFGRASRTSRQPPEPAPSVDDVLLGASAPRCAGRGDEFTARFVAYLADEEDDVRRVLTSTSPRSTSHLGLRTVRWQVGTRVAVRLCGRGVRVAPATQEFIWNGRRAVLDFDVVVGDDARVGTTCVLKYDVAVAGVVVATLRVDLAITAERGIGEPHETRAQTPRTAFASYASEDRDRVVDRVSALHSVAGLDVFLDHLSLVPGENWQERLRREIRSRDVFLLFWSSRARASTWVDWEWKTALRERGIEAILPQPLEPVTVAPVPPELSDLHFGDCYLLLRAQREGGHLTQPAPPVS